MKEPKPIDLNTTVNFVTNKVRKNLEDRKTSIFIAVISINIFLWGLMLSSYKNMERDQEQINDKLDATMWTINKLKAELNE